MTGANMSPVQSKALNIMMYLEVLDRRRGGEFLPAQPATDSGLTTNDQDVDFDYSDVAWGGSEGVGDTELSLLNKQLANSSLTVSEDISVEPNFSFDDLASALLEESDGEGSGDDGNAEWI